MSSQTYWRSSIRRICVEGYDTSLPANDVNFALRDHFSSCGEMTHVYIPKGVKRGLLNRFGFVYVRVEGAEERVLGLSGRDMGGRIIVAKPYPFHETYLEPEVAPLRAADSPRQRTMVVTGYDTRLPKAVVESMLRMHFYLCGRLSFVLPMVYLWGEDRVETALQLSGREVRGLNIVVVKVCPPDRSFGPCGFTPLAPPIYM
ncbi:unnamed protein product [Microthlaspi erraticum]|uniref:RRM domain-containing protein n=1 Tax=Microthlaspi erraticum TaxID=1685480 RepID=A0A6D2IA60_9BRAS|nr:unnamed protein product [Microthlaspi erraticum]CAA7049432.1 unnamed protein product [Microthlaspi erraticum]